MSSVDLSKVMANFRARFTTLYPVIMRREALGGDWGDTSVCKRNGKMVLLIRVEKTLSDEAQLFVLLHELGHAIQWRLNEDSREDDHDAEFGVAYARVWSALI